MAAPRIVPTSVLVGRQGEKGDTGDTGPIGPPGPGTGAGAWEALTDYTATQVVQAPDGSIIQRVSTGTSRATFDSTEEAQWTAVSAVEGTIEQRAQLASIDLQVPAASTTAQGKVELATTAEATTGTDTGRAVTPAGLAAAVPAASTTAVGKVELATSAETTTGTDAVRAVTPAALKAVFDATQAIAGQKSFGLKVTGLAFHAKSAKEVSFMASGIDADNTGASSTFTPMTNAFALLGAGSTFRIPAGTYVWSTPPASTWPNDIRIIGEGSGRTILKCAAGFNSVQFAFTGIGQRMEGITLDQSLASNTAGSEGIRLTGTTGFEYEDLEVIGSAKAGAGTNGVKAIRMQGSVTDTRGRGLASTNCQWGLYTDSTSVIDGVDILGFLVDGGLWDGDGFQFNVPSGSWKRVSVGHGRIKNYIRNTPTPTRGMGVGFAGGGSRADVFDIDGDTIGLDMVHFESANVHDSRTINVRNIKGKSVDRALVSLQAQSTGTYENVILDDLQADACNTAAWASLTGVVELTSSAAGTLKGGKIGRVGIMDSGNAAADTVGILLGATTSYCDVGVTTHARLVGTRAAGSREVVNGGTNNTVATPVYY